MLIEIRHIGLIVSMSNSLFCTAIPVSGWLMSGNRRRIPSLFLLINGDVGDWLLLNPFQRVLILAACLWIARLQGQPDSQKTRRSKSLNQQRQQPSRQHQVDGNTTPRRRLSTYHQQATAVRHKLNTQTYMACRFQVIGLIHAKDVNHRWYGVGQKQSQTGRSSRSDC